MSSIADPLVAEAPHDVHQLLGAAVRGDRETTRVLVERARAVDRQQCGCALQVVPVVDDDLDALAADLRLELVGGAAGDDPPVVDDRDLVGELVRLLEVLRGEEQRGALAHLRSDHVPHAEPAARVESRRRLVEEQQARASDQRAREVEPAAHSAGVRLGDAVGRLLEVEALEQLAGARPRLLAGEAVQTPEHPQVLAPGQVLVDRRVLPGEADHPAHALRVAQHVDAAHDRAAGVRPEQRREDPDGRRLARAVRPEQPEHGALLDREVDAVERADLAAARPVDLDESLCLDRGHRGTLPACGERSTDGRCRRCRPDTGRSTSPRAPCLRCCPFLAERFDLSYAATAAIMLAATVSSSVVQPLFGLALRPPRRDVAPARRRCSSRVSGVALAGLAPSYGLVLVAVAPRWAWGSPRTTRRARSSRRSRAVAGAPAACRYFNIGGNTGYALGPIVITPVVLGLGLAGTLVAALPVLVVGVAVLARAAVPPHAHARGAGHRRRRPSADRPRRDGVARRRDPACAA